LVVVGALHLVGKDSVIDLLRSRGVEVVRLEERGFSVLREPGVSN
jgi:methanogenic corrinoid protein MtbC1